jgi:hypothetical protein
MKAIKMFDELGMWIAYGICHSKSGELIYHDIYNKYEELVAHINTETKQHCIHIEYDGLEDAIQMLKKEEGWLDE